MATAPSSRPAHVYCQRLAHLQRGENPAECVLANGTKLLLPALLASHLAVGDEIRFPVTSPSTAARTEICVEKNSLAGRSRQLYQAPIGYVTLPKVDTGKRHFVSAEVQQSSFGIVSVFLSCEVLREHFYRISPDRGRSAQPTLYELLKMPATASPAELRVGFKLRDLELHRDGARQAERIALERAFNILAQPELRACYDALLADPEAPAVFPYGGFGSLLVAGERSRDGQTFFAHRILAFLPERRQRRFRAPMRQCDFYDDRAFYRDVRRRLELWIDPAVLHLTWDATWNQWKHLLATKMEVSATFVQSGKYRRRRGEWELVQWETALPSRVEVKLPDEIQEQLGAARTTYLRFGQCSAALDRIRTCIQCQAMEKTELEKVCSELRIPGDFDVAQINWRPDYDPFFYRQLSRRARRIYLLRDEYIFDLEKAVVVETPQMGHATYIFAKPRSMEGFLATYTKITKEDIRHNRDNVAAQLSFLGRIIHGVDPRAWFNDLKRRVGETG
jgi:hypothetical protein